MHRLQEKILGRDKELNEMLSLYTQNKLHHTWLISGPTGIGKTMFAEHLALLLLSHASKDQNIDMHRNKMIQGSHFDYMLIESHNDAIKVQEVRALQDFLSLRPIDSSVKVVVINSVNHLNINAANALLKTLEEPNPYVYIFLTCYTMANLLPTIKSRCNNKRLAPLSLKVFLEINHQHNTSFLDQHSIEELYLLANGSLDALSLIRTPEDWSLVKQSIDLAEGNISHIEQIINELQDDVKWQQICFGITYGFYKASKRGNSKNIQRYEKIHTQLHNINASHLSREHAFKSLFI